MAALSKNESELRSMLSSGGMYETWKANAASSRTMEDFSTILRKHDFEPGLVQAVPLVLATAPNARTAFSSTMLRLFEAAVEKRLANFAQLLAIHESAQADRVVAIAAADDAFRAAKSEAEATTAAEQEAYRTAEDGFAVMLAAKNALTEHESSAKQVALAEEEAVSLARTAFGCGPVKSAFGGASASVGAKSKAKARANVVAVKSIRVRGKQAVKSMRLRGKQVVRGRVGAKPRQGADPEDATAERTTAETKFRVLNFLHLNLGLRIGQTYSYGELHRRCRDDSVTIAEMHKKLGDPNFFKEVLA